VERRSFLLDLVVGGAFKRVSRLESVAVDAKRRGRTNR
jgi:hypothetical protein